MRCTLRGEPLSACTWLLTKKVGHMHATGEKQIHTAQLKVTHSRCQAAGPKQLVQS